MTYPVRNTYPPSNAGIIIQLLAEYQGLIDSISYKMGIRYQLSQEDREDLISAARAKICTVRWRSVWIRIRRNYNPALARGAPPSLHNYVISTIQTTMAKELRRIKAEGLSGLSKGPSIAMFPQHIDLPEDSPCR